MLQGMAGSGEPQRLVRGDGTSLGWFLVEKMTQKSASLGDQGIGRQIAWEIALVESPNAASSGSLVGLLDQLFA